MNLRQEKTLALLVPYGTISKGMVLMALIVSTASCAPLPDSVVQTPTQVNPNGLDADRMKELSAIQIPRGLADPHGEFAYVGGPQRLIYRLHLGSGETQARTIFPGSPLAIYDDTLIGWTHAPDFPNAVRLFAVVPQGDVLSPVWEQNLELPTWAAVDSPEPEIFKLEAEIQNEELVVTWEAHSHYLGGAPPPPGVEAAETRDASGAVHIDPRTGTVLSEEKKKLIPGTARPLLELPANWLIVPYIQNESWATQSWTVISGDTFLVRTAGEPGILLVRRESGSAASPVEIRLTEDPTAIAAVTPDGKFVFIHEPGSVSPSWLIYSAETGEMIAKLPFDSGTQGVSVVDDQVYYLVSQELGSTRRSSLRSRDLHTGELMWSFTLDEEATMTPPPPPP